MLDRAAGVLGTVLGLLFLLVQVALGTGVVREHCLDVKATQASGTVQVESHWTYILWPPLYFASIDPSGRCVRNSPLHEALSYVGVWKLAPPAVQVRRHIANQLHNPSTSTTLSPSQSGAVQQARAYLTAVGAALQPLNKAPANPTDYAHARTVLNGIISRLRALVPPTGASDGHRALIAALQRLRNLLPAFERASRSHDSVALSNVERKNVQAQAAINTAAHEIGAYQAACSSDPNKC